MVIHFKKSFLLVVLIIFFPATVFGGDIISASEAFELASNKKIILVDIRGVDEWKDTGVASIAKPVSIHEPLFLSKLDAITDGAKGKPVAFICATGGRTAWLLKELTSRGYTNLLDVSEGMMGNELGAGWLKLGLPIKRYAD